MTSILVSVATLLALQSSPYGLLSGTEGHGFPPDGWTLTNVEVIEGETRFSLSDASGWKISLIVTDRTPGASAFAVSVRRALNYKIEAAPEGEDPGGHPPGVARMLEAAADALVAGDEEPVAGGSSDGAVAGPRPSAALPAGAFRESSLPSGPGAHRQASPDGERHWAAEELLGGSAGYVPELAEGFVFRALSIEGARLRFRFDHPFGGRLDLWVAPRQAGHKGYAETDYLTLWFDLDDSYLQTPEALARLDAFLEQVAASVRLADAGDWAELAPQDSGPGTGDEAGGGAGPDGCRDGQGDGSGRGCSGSDGREGHGPEAGTSRRSAGGAWLAGRPADQAAAITALLALVFSLFSFWRVSGSIGRTVAAAGRIEGFLVLAACAAGAVRLVLVPLVPVKVGMVFPMLEQALSMEGLPRYGAGGAVLAHLVFRFLRPHLDELLRLHSLLALLMPLLAAAAARRLFPEPRVMSFAALFLALTPLFLRDGNTESLLVPGFFLFLAGFHLVLDFVEDGRLSTGLSALPALVAGASMRPEIMVLALALPFLFFARVRAQCRHAAATKKWSRPSRKSTGNGTSGEAANGRPNGLHSAGRFLSVAAVLFLLLLPGILFLAFSTANELAGDNLVLERLHPGFILRNLVALDVLLAPRFFPVSVSLLGFAGAWIAVRDRDYRATSITIILLATGWLALLAVDLNEESMLRLQVPAAMIWCAFAALAGARVVGLARSAAEKTALVAAVLVAFAACSLPGLGSLFVSTSSQEDSRVFHAAVERLPPGRVRLVVLTADDLPELAIADPGRVGETPPPGHVPVHRQLPLYRLRALRPDVDVVSVSRMRAGLPRDSRTFFYLGASCYAYRDAGGQSTWGVPADPQPALHPACRHVLASHRVSRVYLENVANRPELAPAFHWYPRSLRNMTLGLLELESTSPSGRPQDPWASVADDCNREARRLLLAGTLDRAVDVLDQCERLFPASLSVQDHLSSALYLRGTREDRREDLEGAFRSLVRVAEGDPHQPQVLSRLGSVFFFYSKFRTDREMEAEIESRLARDPHDLVGLYLKGLFLFYARRDYASSAAYFHKVLRQKDDEPRVFVYLALDSFYQGRQEEAEAYIARGVALAPVIEDPDVYYVRSIIIRTKDLEQAAGDIERYLELTSGPDRVCHPTKQQWLRKELENLRAGRPSEWWRSREPSEPWNE